jgi:hypothetical protein
MPLSPNLATMISQAGSAVVEHVAKKDSLRLSDDATLRSWTKQFAEFVAIYRSMVRICTKNDGSYIEPQAIKDAVTTADQFLLKHTHWTWEGEWVAARWRRAALDRKKIWEAEEERIRILKEREEKLRQQREEEKILAEARALLNSNSFDYLTEEEWGALRNDALIEEEPTPTAFNLFDPEFDPIQSVDRASPLSDLTTSSVSSPATCVDPLSPPPTTSIPLPSNQKDYIKDSTPDSSPKSPPVVKRGRGRPPGKASARNGAHIGARGTISASAARASTLTVTDEKTGPSTGPLHSDQRATEALATPSIGHKAPTGITSTSISAPTTTSATWKVPTTDPKPITSTLTAARDHPVFIPKNRPGPQTSQLRLPKSSMAAVAVPVIVPNAPPMLPKLDTINISSSSTANTIGKRKTRDDDFEDFLEEDAEGSDEEDEKSLYLMGSGGTLIGTGHLNSPSCLPCARSNSKCFRLNGKSSCARCHQEHMKCPLDKLSIASHLDKTAVASPKTDKPTLPKINKPALPKAPPKKQKGAGVEVRI